MKSIATILCFILSTVIYAQEGYEIKVTLKPFKNQYIYLGHYYGKQLPIIDSVKLDANSQGVFKGTKKLGGGIYLVGYPDKSQYFEFLLDKNQRFSIVADAAKPDALSFQNSPDNVDFRAYQQFMAVNGKRLDSLTTARKNTAPADSIRIIAQILDQNRKIRAYRTNIITNKSKTFLATLLKAMQEPDMAIDPEVLKDKPMSYEYYKKHYWDGVDFFDDRLVRTPFFEGRIDKYLEQVVYPAADSVIRELDYMLSYASISEDMQRFLLLKFANRYLNQKFMWEDAVFVHLFEKYFSGKTYPWLNAQGMKVITDRAYSLMANITGTSASEIELTDTAGKKTSLYSLEAPYTIVTIWDPTCGHCKEVLPQLDSAYRARWKSMGVKVFGLAKETDGKKSDWITFIQNNKLQDWRHVYYSKVEDVARTGSGIPSYSQLYDVQTFPTLYLLDKDKRIIAKKVTIQQIDEILSHREKNQ